MKSAVYALALVAAFNAGAIYQQAFHAPTSPEPPTICATVMLYPASGLDATLTLTDVYSSSSQPAGNSYGVGVRGTYEHEPSLYGALKEALDNAAAVTIALPNHVAAGQPPMPSYYTDDQGTRVRPAPGSAK